MAAGWRPIRDDLASGQTATGGASGDGGAGCWRQSLEPAQADQPLAAVERLRHVPRAPPAEALHLAGQRRVSLMTEVIRTPSSPHGTIQENGCRSFSTLTAKPWVLTPRATCTPIEAIFRSSTHTPVKSRPSAEPRPP